MTEELKNEDTEIKKCTCAKDLFTKLALITTGSFVGCLLALSVFTAFAKPIMPPPPAHGQLHRVPPIGAEYNRPDRKAHSVNKQELRHKKFEKQNYKEHRPDKPDRSEKPKLEQNKPSK